MSPIAHISKAPNSPDIGSGGIVILAGHGDFPSLKQSLLPAKTLLKSYAKAYTKGKENRRGEDCTERKSPNIVGMESGCMSENWLSRVEKYEP